MSGLFRKSAAGYEETKKGWEGRISLRLLPTISFRAGKRRRKNYWDQTNLKKAGLKRRFFFHYSRKMTKLARGGDLDGTYQSRIINF